MSARAPGAGQLDLFAEQEAADKAVREAQAPCIHDSSARGVLAREAEFEAWCAEYGRSDSLARSHAWRAVIPVYVKADRCQAWTLTASTRRSETCAGHDRDLRYKGACLACDWEGPARDDENTAAEDASDHAWPGWRDQPLMPNTPYGDKPVKTWLAKAGAAYPPGWIDAGGPVRTVRSGAGTRSHYAHEWGGFNMCGEIVEDET